MSISAGGRYLPLAIGSAAAAAANPLSYGGPLAGSRRLQQAFSLECIGTLKGPVTRCCFLPQQQRSSNSNSNKEAAAAAAEEEEEDEFEEEEGGGINALLRSSSNNKRTQQQQQQQQQISNSCLLAEGTRVFVGSCKDTPEAQKFFSAKSPVTALAARSDGALCAVGEESGLLSAVSVNSRKSLRRFQGGSKAPLRCCCFGGERQTLFGAGDDCVVREWSLETGALAAELQGHSDSVRGVCSIEGLGSLAATASYDATAKLWDSRTRTACLTLPQGDPTECVRIFEDAGTLKLLAAAGTEVRLWDIRQPGEAACSLNNFAKTVTTVKEFPAAAAAGASTAVANGASSSGLLVAAASLDNVVRIFSLDTLQLLQCFSVRSDLLCLDVATGSSSSSSKGSSSNSSCCRLVMGLSDGGWILRRAAGGPSADEELMLLQQQQQQQQQRKRLLMLKPTDGGYFKRGRTAPPNPGDAVNESLQTRRLSRLDRLVKSFQYQAAMDVALTTTPQHVIALSAELLQRGGLLAAMRGRDALSVLSLLRFGAQHVAFKAPNQTEVVLQLLHALLEENERWIVETRQEAEEIKALLKKICQRVAFELEQIRRLARVEALVDALLAV